MFEPERSVSPEPVQIYGRLHHLKGKTKAIKQSCDIDCPVITIGRDQSSDIRIHALDVSRTHCKITFDLITGKAVIEILSKAGLKINKTLLPLGTQHTLQDGDVISVAVRRFKFEYAQDSGEGSGLEAPWLPDSPAPTRSYGGQANFGEEDQVPGSPMRPSTRATGSTRFAASSRRRNSTRLHLFPEHAASKEVKDAILALAGNETPSAEDEAAGKKRDLAYMEMVDEDDEQGTGVGIEAKILEAANSPVKPQRALPRSFATPQPGKKILKAPRTSLVPRTRKNVRMAVQEEDVPVEAIEPVQVQEESKVEMTPSQIPLPPTENTPYVLQTGLYPSLDELDQDLDNSFDSEGPSSPSPLVPGQGMYSTPTPKNKFIDLLAKEEGGLAGYQTPRNVPLPASMDTPYVTERADHGEEEESQDVEMEDVEGVQDTSMGAPVTPPKTTQMEQEETSPLTFNDENQPPAPVSPVRNGDDHEVDLRSLMPLTPKPRTGRNSLRRNLLLHSSQKVMEAQLVQRQRMMQQMASARNGQSQIIAPTPMRFQSTPYKTALPSPGVTDYESSESDEEEREEVAFEDASDHFDEEEEYEDVSGAYETDAEELHGEAEDEEDDEDEQDEVATPVQAHANSVSSASFTPSIRRIINEEIAAAGDSSDDDVDRSLDVGAMDDSDSGHEHEQQEYAYEQGQAEQEDDEEMEQEEEYEEAQEIPIDPALVPLPETPVQRTLGERFFTPQYIARKSARAQPRKSLDNFGPPVKFQAMLATPVREAVDRMSYDMDQQDGESDREFVKQEEAEEESQAEADHSETEREPVSYQQEFEQAELKKQQEAWEQSQKANSRRRTLPAPPAGFETPEVAARPLELRMPETAQHPALAGHKIDEVSSDEDEVEVVAKDPLSDIKSHLKSLRRKSLHRQSVGGPSRPIDMNNRRATVGLAQPTTPRASSRAPQQFYSAAPASRFGNVLAPPQYATQGMEEQATVSMRDVNPTGAASAQANKIHEDDEGSNDEADSARSEIDEDVPTAKPESDNGMDVEQAGEPETEVQPERDVSPPTQATESMANLNISNAPATPEYRGLKEMLNIKTLQTPKFTGLREMYAEVRDAQTPLMNGIKNMFAQPANPSTPDMSGLKHMMAEPAQRSTPDLNGLQDVLYKQDPGEQEHQEEPADTEVQEEQEQQEETPDEQPSETISVAKPSRVSSKASIPAVTTTRTRRKVAEPAADEAGPSTSTAAVTKRSTTTTARTTRTRAPAVAEETASVEPVKRSRTRTAAASAEPTPAPVTAARATRATKTSTAVPARATRAKASATPEVPEEPVKPAQEETIVLVKPTVPSRVGRTTAARSAATTTTATRKAAPLKTTTAPPQVPEEAVAEEAGSKPKARATRTTRAVKVEETPAEENESAAVAPKRRTARTGASDLTAPTASSKARAASSAASNAASTTTTARKVPATRTRAAATAPVVLEEEVAVPKRVTRARK
ncbi:hypothetical protein FFLO_00257 [Filobasidium floriforme]|uniref:FHA domain-containing protein n=1 Tax=Filobasidium floriforme TaxID=5210 RepID=A0A8K0JSK3_9TREE|nr:uncharacterized protein HD553DRAFT_313745 [Filobasidium floriforme]KAG7575438.1 hypothetical protein FFLO_00257 [Filobasidium floriforme]KAH8082574.1 hypothetical protein HD553DRAFT_313745 [Filobasidium floriforme]